MSAVHIIEYVGGWVETGGALVTLIGLLIAVFAAYGHGKGWIVRALHRMGRLISIRSRVEGSAAGEIRITGTATGSVNITGSGSVTVGQGLWTKVVEIPNDLEPSQVNQIIVWQLRGMDTARREGMRDLITRLADTDAKIGTTRSDLERKLSTTEVNLRRSQLEQAKQGLVVATVGAGFGFLGVLAQSMFF